MGRIKKTGWSGKSLWLLGGVLLASNSILSYSSLPPWSKLLIFCFGILIPLIAFILKTPPEKGAMVTEGRSFSDWRSSWIWAVLIGLALFLRFYRITDFHLWPTGDEGLHGFLAIDLVQNPRWQFFYTVGQHPPLLIWFLAFFFKFFTSPLFNLWFLPAVFSVLAVLAGFAVSRLFFSSSFSLVFTGLLAFSFWPLYFGRFCIQGVFIPFWELVCFLLLVYAIKSKNPQERDRWLLALGFWTGLGSLTYTSWLVVLFALTVTVFVLFFKKSIRSFYLYLAGLGAACLPFVLSAFSPGSGFGNHMISSTISSHFFTLRQQALNSISYLTSLFWGCGQAGASYGPVWGGMLNPVLAACFQIGLLELFLHRRDGFARWTAFFLGAGLLPGLLTADYVGFNRVIQVMPFLILVAAIGLQRLFLSLKPGKGRIGAALILGLSSFALDLNHLVLAQKAGAGAALSDDNLAAYRLLDSARSQLGPGLLFTDFLPLSHNHSLNVGTYWFNAALNPKLDPAQSRWAGVITNVHYQHYLAGRFPKSQWFWIDQNSPGNDGGLTVGIIPLTAENQALFQLWMKAHAIFHDLNVQAENIQNQKDLYIQAEMDFPKYDSLMGQDPFLESTYDEWISQYHYGTGYLKNIEAIRRAIQKGYPTACLYCELGNFYWAEGHFPEARDAYRTALAQKPNYTVAADLVRYMDKLISEKPEQ